MWRYCSDKILILGGGCFAGSVRPGKAYRAVEELVSALELEGCGCTAAAGVMAWYCRSPFLRSTQFSACANN